ncbi:BTB/POZ domain-containing protein 9-like [Dysidea avara]|uniref:BTB/POZ domain-containing protein 9-like n=1 Tax=Dysidea avara TaxID=196820 RepID=UPI003332BEAA
MAKQEKIIISKELKKDTLQDENWCATVLSSLLKDPSTHDVTFKTSDGGSVSAHRVIVAAGSPVFHAMLYGNMKESSQKEIKLPTVDTSMFKILLIFMYSGKVEINSDNCLDILEAAYFFNIAALETKSADFIAGMINVENCCSIATVANAKQFNTLLEKCLEFIYINCDKIIENSSFYSLPSEIVLAICQSSSLHVDEIKLFLALVKWQKNQERPISKSGSEKLFNNIRYPMMSVDDLLEKVRPTKMADPVLYTLALEYHHKPNTYDGPPNQLVPRKYLEVAPKKCFVATNITPNTIASSSDGASVTITKLGSSNWDGLCVLQVYPKEQFPVHFTFQIKQTSSDLSGIQLVVRSCLFSSLTADNFRGGVDGSVGHKVEGTIAIGNNNITTTIGGKTLNTTKQSDGIYLCVYLYYQNNSVIVTIN